MKASARQALVKQLDDFTISKTSTMNTYQDLADLQDIVTFSKAEASACHAKYFRAATICPSAPIHHSALDDFLVPII